MLGRDEMKLKIIKQKALDNRDNKKNTNNFNNQF